MLVHHPDGLLRYVGDETGVSARVRVDAEALDAPWVLRALAARGVFVGQDGDRPYCSAVLGDPERPQAVLVAYRPGAGGHVHPGRRPAGRGAGAAGGVLAVGGRAGRPPGRGARPRRGVRGGEPGAGRGLARRPSRRWPCCASPRTGCPGSRPASTARTRSDEIVSRALLGGARGGLAARRDRAGQRHGRRAAAVTSTGSAPGPHRGGVDHDRPARGRRRSVIRRGRNLPLAAWAAIGGTATVSRCRARRRRCWPAAGWTRLEIRRPRASGCWSAWLLVGARPCSGPAG